MASDPFRVTHRSVGLRTLQGLQGNLSRLGELQAQLSSGKAVTRPSDSPSAATAALRFRSEVRANEQYARNADDGIGWLGTIDSALTSSLGGVRRVRELTLAGKNTGATSDAGREAMAVEIDRIREGLVDLANTRYLDRPVFGGTTPGSSAYAADGSYLGDAGTVRRSIADGVSLRVDVTGPEVFGAGAGSLFSVLSDLSANLRGDPAALDGDLERLDAAMARIQDRLSDVGARYNRLEQARDGAELRVDDLRSALSEAEDIDLPKTIVELQMQQAAYEAALGATKRVVQPSLVDFLR